MGYHGSPVAASQRVLQKSCQFAVPVVNKLSLVVDPTQCVDAVAKSQQRPVNVRSFDHTFATILRIRVQQSWNS